MWVHRFYRSIGEVLTGCVWVHRFYRSIGEVLIVCVRTGWGLIVSTKGAKGGKRGD